MRSDRAGPSRAATQTDVHQEQRGKRRRPKTRSGLETEELPGVQKLKAALRQTRRLLAKDNLAADVRVETERRLKSLQSDLRAAEHQRKEREMAKRYHKVKFFEKRKVLRKLKRVKRELEEVKAGTPEETAAHLKDALFELRAQLNYILSYPKLEKYISLFPPSKDESERNPDLGNAERPPVSETDARREQLLIEIKSKMVSGLLSGKPELDVREAVHVPSATTGTNQRNPGKSGAPSGVSQRTSRSQKITTAEGGKAEPVTEDEFFDIASESDSGSS